MELTARQYELQGFRQALAREIENERTYEQAQKENAQLPPDPTVAKLKISVQVIHVMCPCGGNCEDEQEERAIGYLDKVVWCRMCGARYEVPVEAFPKFEQSVI